MLRHSVPCLPVVSLPARCRAGGVQGWHSLTSREGRTSAMLYRLAPGGQGLEGRGLAAMAGTPAAPSSIYRWTADGERLGIGCTCGRMCLSCQVSHPMPLPFAPPSRCTYSGADKSTCIRPMLVRSHTGGPGEPSSMVTYYYYIHAQTLRAYLRTLLLSCQTCPNAPDAPVAETSPRVYTSTPEAQRTLKESPAKSGHVPTRPLVMQDASYVSRRSLIWNVSRRSSNSSMS